MQREQNASSQCRNGSTKMLRKISAKRHKSRIWCSAAALWCLQHKVRGSRSLLCCCLITKVSLSLSDFYFFPFVLISFELTQLTQSRSGCPYLTALALICSVLCTFYKPFQQKYQPFFFFFQAVLIRLCGLFYCTIRSHRICTSIEDTLTSPLSFPLCYVPLCYEPIIPNLQVGG